MTIKDDVQKKYVLATGAAAVDRLMLLNEIFGLGTDDEGRKRGAKDWSK